MRQITSSQMASRSRSPSSRRSNSAWTTVPFRVWIVVSPLPRRIWSSCGFVQCRLRAMEVTLICRIGSMTRNVSGHAVNTPRRHRPAQGCRQRSRHESTGRKPGSRPCGSPEDEMRISISRPCRGPEVTIATMPDSQSPPSRLAGVRTSMTRASGITDALRHALAGRARASEDCVPKRHKDRLSVHRWTRIPRLEPAAQPARGIEGREMEAR